MPPLTSLDASRITLGLIQFMRSKTNAGPAFTLANLATLLAVCENPGALQADIEKSVDGIDGGTLTRHLNMLAGIKRADANTAMAPLVRTERNAINRRLNDVFLTEQGQEFATELAAYFNRLLARSLR